MEPERVDYAAWIGLDWGSEKHALCLKAADSSSLERCTLEQKPEALHGWFMNLLARFSGRKVALAIEQTRGRSFISCLVLISCIFSESIPSR